MADNIILPTIGSGTSTPVVSTDEVTTLNGDVVTAQHVQRIALALRTADGTAIDLPGDAANGLDTDVTRSALPDGAATAAHQITSQTSLTAIAASVAGGEPFGLNDDAAALPGAEGSIQARLRLMTSQLESIKSAVELMAETFVEAMEEWRATRDEEL